MKTLYASDLDGTLLNNQEQVTARSVRLLNACLEKGMSFTVATARMPYECDFILSSLRLTEPCILTNGVFLYEFHTGRYLSVESMPQDGVYAALQAFARHSVPCFLYTYRDNGIGLYYCEDELRLQTQYYTERAMKFCREVKQTGSLAPLAAGRDAVVYLAATDTDERLSPVCAALDQIAGISYAKYLNIYNDLYCVEVFSAGASKRMALEKLLKIGGYDELVVFGDNLNDLSMFELADQCYAPDNALPEVKRRADGIIGANSADGVAVFLAQRFNI